MIFYYLSSNFSLRQSLFFLSTKHLFVQQLFSFSSLLIYDVILVTGTNIHYPVLQLDNPEPHASDQHEARLGASGGCHPSVTELQGIVAAFLQ